MRMRRLGITTLPEVVGPANLEATAEDELGLSESSARSGSDEKSLGGNHFE